MPTFYIASSVHNVKQVRLVADYLIEHGMTWSADHDWTRYDENDAPVKSIAAGLLAAADIMGAVAADLFILLRTDVTSHGAHAEFGARLALNKTVHLILQNAPYHLFYDHPLVVQHKTIEDFLSFMRHGSKCPRDLIPRARSK